MLHKKMSPNGGDQMGTGIQATCLVPESYLQASLNVNRIDAALHFIRPMTLDRSLSTTIQNHLRRQWGQLIAVRSVIAGGSK